MALAAALGWHEQQENRRFIELSHRLEELKLLVQSQSGGKVDLHMAPQIAEEALAEKVAERVLANMGRPVSALNPSVRMDPAHADAADAESPEPPPRTREQQGLVVQAKQVVDRSIRSGHLTRADVIELRHVFSNVGGGPEQAELRTQVLRAINDQKLVPEDPGFILF